MLWLLLSIACTAARLYFSPTLLAPATRPGGSKKLGEDTVGTAGQNWPKLTLFQAHQEKWRGGWAEVCFWEVAIAFAEFVPSTLLSFSDCAFISTLCCSHSLLPLPKGGRKQLGSASAAGQGQNLGNFILFFFFYIKFAEESAYTGWCFLNLGTPNYVCFKINLPPILLIVFKVHINIPTTEFNYSKTNMLLSVKPYTLHSWKMLFQAKESPPTRICMMYFSSTISAMWSCASMLLFIIYI